MSETLTRQLKQNSHDKCLKCPPSAFTQARSINSSLQIRPVGLSVVKYVKIGQFFFATGSVGTYIRCGGQC